MVSDSIMRHSSSDLPLYSDFEMHLTSGATYLIIFVSRHFTRDEMDLF